MQVPIWQLALAVVAGVAAGLVYFGGLWLTVQRLPTSRRPGVLALVSFAVRLAVSVAVMGLCARRHWQLLAACVAAFLVTRVVLVRRWAPERAAAKAGPRPPADEG
ncbi:MAG: ATP synthase subunit I [Planctomycetes bacterium]|nr:ATP synthase subunit I [Planctomycetota bacterium]